MTNNLLRKYAELLVHYSMDIKKGNRLFISSSYLAEDLAKEVYREALAIGAHVDFDININGQEKILYDTASEQQLKDVSPLIKYVAENYDSLLKIIAPFNLRELQNVDAHKKQLFNMARDELNKTFMTRSAEGTLRWNICVFPTDAAAQESGMSKQEYAEFVYSACLLYEDNPVDAWRNCSEEQQKIVDYLNGKEEIKYKGPDIDITFSAKERTWINSDGRFNMPSGEVFTSPVEDSVNGKIRFSYPGFYMGEEIEDIRLEIKEGQVIKWQAQKGQELLDKIFEIPGARRFGEAAIGTNYGIKKFTKNMLFDEKIGGTIHLAVGGAFPETGGTNHSSVHWDMLADMKIDSEIYADGEIIYKDGKFII